MNEKKSIIFGIIFLFVLITSGIWVGNSTRELNQTRRQLDTVRKQLAESTDTNRQLTERIGNCKSIVGELEQTTARDITSVRECIEILEEIRVEIESLEVELGIYSTDDAYNRIDNWLRSEGIIVPE